MKEKLVQTLERKREKKGDKEKGDKRRLELTGVRHKERGRRMGD